MKKQTRGQRNHNPLNIRKTADKWKGLLLDLPFPDVLDKEFCTFESDFFGIRAGFKVLLSYWNRFMRDNVSFSISNIISRWAPAKENRTDRYIYTLSRWLNIPPDEDLSIFDRKRMVALVHSMAIFESQMDLPLDLIESAYDNVFGA